MWLNQRTGSYCHNSSSFRKTLTEISTKAKQSNKVMMATRRFCFKDLVCGIFLTVPYISLIRCSFYEKLIHNQIINACSHHAFVSIIRITDNRLTSNVKRSINQYGNTSYLTKFFN